jgi:hypothetical protein
MKVIQNCLNKEDFVNLKNLMISKIFPWYITWGIAYSDKKDYQFTHNFYKDYEIKSNYFNLLKPILKKLNIASIIRIKANLLIKSNKIIKHGFHVDYDIKNAKTAIFYINTNNGFTEFKNKKISKSEENKLIVFNSNLEHTGTSCTDEVFRIVINFNYFENDIK